MAPRKLLPVCASTDRAAWESAWKAALPRLLERCMWITGYDRDAADDLAGEVAAYLCAQPGAGKLGGAYLIRVACRLAALRWRRTCRDRTYRAGRLRQAADFIRRRNGVKVDTASRFAEGAAEGTVESAMDSGIEKNGTYLK